MVLVTGTRQRLSPDDTLEQAGLQNGDILTAVIGKYVRIFSNSYAFVAVKGEDTAVTWGDEWNGGDSRAVQAHLSGDAQHMLRGGW